MGPVLMFTNIFFVFIYLWIPFPVLVEVYHIPEALGKLSLFHSQLPWLADWFCNHRVVTECFRIVGVSIRCHINHCSLSWGVVYFPVLHVDPKKASL